jgi:hypothetical protein
MAAFIFRCPRTDMNVQGYIADDPTEDTSEYLPIECLVCRGVHLVNPKTGKALGQNEEE